MHLRRSSARIALLLAVAAALAAPAGAQQGPRPAPSLSLRQANELNRLARLALQRYLASRTPADAQQIPPALAALADRNDPVAVSLSYKGAVTEPVVARDGSLCRNLITAALAALRSEELPDRIDLGVVNALTLYVEIHGPAEEATTEALDALLAPGLAALTARRGEAEAWTPAVTAYLRGMNAAEMRRHGLAALPAGGPEVRWRVRAVRAFVAGRDGRATWLLRGKVLLPFEAIDPAALTAAAERTGRFLLAHQTPEGVYALSEGQAAAASNFREHLAATWAMTRLAQRRGDVPAYAASATRAVQAALAQVRREGKRLTIPADRLDHEVTAAAWMLRLAGQMGESPRAAELREGMRQTITDALAEQRLAEALAGENADRIARAAALGLLALRQSGTDDARTRAIADALAEAKVTDLRARLWAGLAGLELAPAGPEPHWHTGRVAEDRRGGLSQGPGEPDTITTALFAQLMAARAKASAGGADSTASDAGQQAARLAGRARRFCYRQVYTHPAEAWFAAEPDAWLGGVRVDPGTSRISLAACAAALEALLTAPPQAQTGGAGDG